MSEIDYWLDYVHDSLQSSDFKQLNVGLHSFGSSLENAYLLGQLSIEFGGYLFVGLSARYAVVAFVYLTHPTDRSHHTHPSEGNNIWARMMKQKGNGPTFLIRWYQHVCSLALAMETNAMATKSQNDAGKVIRSAVREIYSHVQGQSEQGRLWNGHL